MVVLLVVDRNISAANHHQDLQQYSDADERLLTQSQCHEFTVAGLYLSLYISIQSKFQHADKDDYRPHSMLALSTRTQLILPSCKSVVDLAL